MEKALKDVELKLISELMKDSRRSDRELAKAIGVSQPTVSRARRGQYRRLGEFPSRSQRQEQLQVFEHVGNIQPHSFREKWHARAQVRLRSVRNV